ncbi:MAG: aminoacyl-histidine dipeptidase [Mariniphaga sp.]
MGANDTNKLGGLEPASVWSYFEAVCQIPRPSKREEKIIQFLTDFAHLHNFNIKTDFAGNVLISKPASKGLENVRTLVLQSHLDMVCEKNSETIHNFDTDPIKPYIDGEWVTAEGTTLGADCGIGIAAQMAVLTSEDLKHGPIECLFTVDEETGLTGANALEPGFFSGKGLINLDSEDEGELFIGCAGGIDTLATIHYKDVATPKGMFPIKIKVSGLLGGHSGDDINKNRGNAIKVLNRFLWQIIQKYEIHISEFNGGNLRNAIAREAFAVLLVPGSKKENVTIEFNIFRSMIEEEMLINEPSIKLSLESTGQPGRVIDESSQKQLIQALYACPHGVLTMSTRMPGLVETSTNLASVKLKPGNLIEITTSQRSDLESGKLDASNMVSSVFQLINADIRHGEGYPGWTPNPSSELLNITRLAYIKLFKVEPVVRSIHAGLECGLFLEKFPGLDMISFGPTMRGVHSPDEKINIASVEKFWRLLIEVIADYS